MDLLLDLKWRQPVVPARHPPAPTAKLDRLYMPEAHAWLVVFAQVAPRCPNLVRPAPTALRALQLEPQYCARQAITGRLLAKAHRHVLGHATPPPDLTAPLGLRLLRVVNAPRDTLAQVAFQTRLLVDPVSSVPLAQCCASPPSAPTAKVDQLEVLESHAWLVVFAQAALRSPSFALAATTALLALHLATQHCVRQALTGRPLAEAPRRVLGHARPSPDLTAPLGLRLRRVVYAIWETPVLVARLTRLLVDKVITVPRAQQRVHSAHLEDMEVLLDLYHRRTVVYARPPSAPTAPMGLRLRLALHAPLVVFAQVAPRCPSFVLAAPTALVLESQHCARQALTGRPLAKVPRHVLAHAPSAPDFTAPLGLRVRVVPHAPRDTLAQVALPTRIFVDSVITVPLAQQRLHPAQLEDMEFLLDLQLVLPARHKVAPTAPLVLRLRLAIPAPLDTPVLVARLTRLLVDSVTSVSLAQR